MKKGLLRLAGVLLLALMVISPPVRGQGFGEGGREGLIRKLKEDLGMLGWRGRRDPSIRDRKDAAKDLELRRLQQEKEQRIGAARKAGAEITFDEHNRALFERNREDAAKRRRADWRPLACPGS